MPFAEELDNLLEQGEVAGHDLIEGELLIGDPAGRVELLRSYNRLHRAAGVPHAEVFAFVRAHRLHGMGIGWIDAHLLASALVAGVPLWTADERLVKVAGQLGVCYSPGAHQ
jgi:hypothetical protein